MAKKTEKEIWKKVVTHFDFETTNKLDLEISNFGRLKSYSKISKGNLLSTSLMKGYPVVRFKLYTERDSKSNQRLEYFRIQIALLQEQIIKIRKELLDIKSKGKTSVKHERSILQQEKLLDLIKQNYKKDLRKIENARTINFGFLIHRLVAEYFVDKPTPDHTIVAHLDFDKANNHYSNIRWMNAKEHLVHREMSPRVIQARKDRIGIHNLNSKQYKLTIPKVRVIKKRINQGVTLSSLSKKYNITQTQLLRIKRGENWSTIPAAL